MWGDFEWCDGSDVRGYECWSFELDHPLQSQPLLAAQLSVMDFTIQAFPALPAPRVYILGHNFLLSPGNGERRCDWPDYRCASLLATLLRNPFQHSGSETILFWQQEIQLLLWPVIRPLSLQPYS